jgi:hypothetical protein
MRGLVLAWITLAASAPAALAQAANGLGTFVPVDGCGGRSAFVGSSAIIEDSSANCNVAVGSSLTYSSITGVYTLAVSLPGAQVGDAVYFAGGAGSTPSCLTSTVFSIQTANAGDTSFTFAPLTCTPSGSVNANGATAYVNYLKSGVSGNRYELKLLQQSSPGSWASPTTTLLTTSAVRSALFGAACSVGNPVGYFDGTDYYIAFIAQDATLSLGCANNATTPGKGLAYDLWACYLGSSLSTTLSSSNCGEIEPASASGDAFLDPHIWSNYHVYVSERKNSAVNAYTSTYISWAIDDVNVSWSGTPSATLTPWIFLTTAGWNTGRTRATANCEEYYKLTGLFALPGQTYPRVFFQMNYINGPSTNSPFTGVNGGGTCEGYGAGTASDQFWFSGLFYGDLTGSAVGTGVYKGSNLTPIYPYPSQTTASGSCLTPQDGYVYCYGEYPWIFHDGTKMLFIGNTVTQYPIVNTCGGTSGCQVNYTSELIQAQVTADYTQSALPMGIGFLGSFSTMMDLNTANCGQTLSASGSGTSTCGLDGGSGYYGNCGHLDIDEASGYLTCANLTNIPYPGTSTTFYINRTMVVQLTPAFFNSPVSASGLFRMSGGVQLRSQ